ncbi:hypothetical protein B566_EDAN015833 [Ephemera danica]|nr:hypothetical protein B566_EDAN015833 [Ephemera danica]
MRVLEYIIGVHQLQINTGTTTSAHVSRGSAGQGYTFNCIAGYIRRKRLQLQFHEVKQDVDPTTSSGNSSRISSSLACSSSRALRHEAGAGTTLGPAVCRLCSSASQHHWLGHLLAPSSDVIWLCRVDNNNAVAEPTSQQQEVEQQQTGEAANNNAAALEAWALGLERNNRSPCTPEEEEDDDDEEGVGRGGARSSSSSGVSEADEEEARSSSCPSACSSTSSEASELANLASSSSGGSGESGAESAPCSDDEQPASPVPPFVAPEQRRQHGDTDVIRFRRVRLISECVSTTDELQSFTVSRAGSDAVTPGSTRDMSESEDEAKQVTPTPPGKPETTPRSSSSNNNSSVSSSETLGAFDVFTMETALPKLDLAQLESHLLAAARSEDRRSVGAEMASATSGSSSSSGVQFELGARVTPRRHYKKDSRYLGDLYTLTYDEGETLECTSYMMNAVDHDRRNDREEIRRRLAMGEEPERPGGRKPSLQSRLQSGMNLQLCFMNETASDCESTPDHEIKRPTAATAPPVPVPISLPKSTSLDPGQMQREAQLALAQASAMAHMEMALERHQMRLTATPSNSEVSWFVFVGVVFPPERRRVSRQLLTDMNVTQLQVLVNDLHTLIEGLNEELVQLLMERDDLHMEQDSRLVDIEDLNRYLGAKSQPVSTGLHQ